MQYFVLFLFFFFLFSFPVHGSSDGNKIPFRYCSNATFSPNSTYLSNLKILFSALSSNSSTKLYHNSSAGRPPNPTAYGDFQCCGDLDVTACRQCVAAATANSSQVFCPLSVEAVIWLDKCVLRYCNRSFFSVMEDSPSVNTCNVFYVGNGKDVVEAFEKVVITALNATAKKASSMSGALKFATEEVNFKDATVYMLAECSGDLSDFNCGKCLRPALQDLQYYCSGKTGGTIVS
ncbi:cysteine-rich repeat secretory protein 1-like [Benincasa hispida]|uniref:cysteine-rich repeat secretory protein 1-like n=1 Tax=Benincasa hispida TaxID=102211 RepID=UPI0018FF28F4|nr:cysteine-rich repeat secretory protein 1-like [Benincasa hispida]